MEPERKYIITCIKLILAQFRQVIRAAFSLPFFYLYKAIISLLITLNGNAEETGKDKFTFVTTREMHQRAGSLANLLYYLQKNGIDLRRKYLQNFLLLRRTSCRNKLKIFFPTFFHSFLESVKESDKEKPGVKFLRTV